jgi:cell wall-associated NlpC family hydrolase
VASTGRTQVIRALTVLALTGAAVAVPAVSAEAVPAPSTCAQTRAQFTANGQAAEKVAEQLNDAKIAKAKAQKQVAAATAKARTAGATYGEAARDFKRIVSGELKSAPAGQFAVFFTSRSPKEFADQMALMDYVAGRKGQQIDQLAGIRAAALKAQSDVQAKLAAQTKIEQTMTAKSADLRKRADHADRPAAEPLRRRPAGRAGGPGQPGHAAGRRRPGQRAAQKAVQTALAQIGDPYVWAAAGPDAFDCSGLTSYAWAAAGVSLPHSSSQQYGYGTHVSRSQVRAGDLVFFYSPISHVGIAINNTQMVHASTFGVPVKVADIDSSPFVGATRLG